MLDETQDLIHVVASMPDAYKLKNTSRVIKDLRNMVQVRTNMTQKVAIHNGLDELSGNLIEVVDGLMLFPIRLKRSVRAMYESFVDIEGTLKEVDARRRSID